jgi:hypothetical protein
MRAAWIASESGEPVFAMVPHSTTTTSRDHGTGETARMRHMPTRTEWRHRRARQDWRDRREGERQRAGGVR